MQMTAEDTGEVTVRLILTVTSSGGTNIGQLQDDCGKCNYCSDKPKFGGKGTKRQKCVLKGLPPICEPKVAAALRLMSQTEVEMLEAYRSMSPPPELKTAMAEAPIPLVWAFQRARRARPLPPAYVLMYHCERKVPLDRSYLRISLEHKCARATPHHHTPSHPHDLRALQRSPRV